MIRYLVSYAQPQTHYIRIECVIERTGGGDLTVQLPAWRPGRYELGNFAKNVRGFSALTAEGRPLAVRKLTKDSWIITTGGADTVHVCYEYYASELNAGSTYLDEQQLYMNPVNCCIYVPGRTEEEHVVELRVPEHYEVACALKRKDKHTLVAPDYDRLADSPFIASPSLQHNFFVLDGVEFHLWFQGECKPDWPKIIRDFFIFVNEQMMMMRHFPGEEYHFLFQILPHRMYHGVEHLDSTVIALGPSYKLMTEVYNDFLGVSCHELYHAWNIKSIRPAEMYPYDLTKENYSKLGYVCEGVTTYYGDYLLFRSGVFSFDEYVDTFNERLQKHFENHGRYLLSVADSSFDTWLDGYVPGAPYRKVSIYDEGNLLAFVTDTIIRQATGDVKSLDDVMRILYDDYARKGKGYTDEDYIKTVEQVSGRPMQAFFTRYAYTPASYEEILENALSYIGCTLVKTVTRKVHEQWYGFKVTEPNGATRIHAVYPGSPAEAAGLAVNDEVLSVNGMLLKADLFEWVRYFGKHPITITVSSAGEVKTLVVDPGKEAFYPVYHVEKLGNPSEEQRRHYEAWSGKRF